eukprot:CAMPEP_0176344336 /NCGR_PEP_ID=MMETSP0126-20121128/4629_1 /TAXON_ID=141414 ORGANISM="Strombidinopsis acuminatum, Strain SPMC142" /NCGR_SAMPLE_ID=MMETSP0126 /ASSEMBLY_ACC=CAM_ASM_000229 /LENGTH=35 /DNA_ID= /DNA_START= /DNA_END= /DNA_ORIENTATION=
MNELLRKHDLAYIRKEEMDQLGLSLRKLNNDWEDK